MGKVLKKFQQFEEDLFVKRLFANSFVNFEKIFSVPIWINNAVIENIKKILLQTKIKK